jgi:P-type Mg2+ transporter
MIRTQHVPFIESRAATPVILLTASIMALGIYLPFSPLGAHLGMVLLPLAHFFGWLAAILLSYCVLTQLVKVAYVRRFGQWL